MKQFLLLLITSSFCTVQAQQINGVFTDFARNDDWPNTVINSAVLETSGYITLGGYYEGNQRSGITNGEFVSYRNKMPLVMQINGQGAIRSDFGGGGGFMLTSVNSTYGSTVVDKTYIANNSSTANAIQLIIAGHETDQVAEDGFMIKSFPTSARPTAFNGGNTASFSGGGASARGFIEDWYTTGSFVYSVRINGATFGNARVLLSGFHKDTYAPILSFGDSGTLRINAPEGDIVNFSRPVRLTGLSAAANFYVAFSTMASIGNGRGIALCRVNWNTGIIDSSFGTNGFKTISTNSWYYITSVFADNNQNITIGGYSDEGLQSLPSFTTFNNDGSVLISGFINNPLPGFGSKNVAAKPATINGQERIVYTYAKPVDANGHYSIAIGSHQPGSAAADPLVHTPWLGSEFVSAEPTAIVTLLNNAGFIVAGNATRSNGTFAGVVLKYKIDGTMDSTFGTNGFLIINAREGGQQWTDAIQLTNNKYLAVGNNTFVPTNLQKSAILLNRFNSDGSIDENFGTNGTVYAHQSDYSRISRSVVPLSNGQFLLAGSYYSYSGEPGMGTTSSGTYATVFKFNEDGSPDNSFGPFNNGRYHYIGYPGMAFGTLQVIGGNIYTLGNPSGGTGMVAKLSAGGNITGTYFSSLTLVQKYIADETTGDLYAAGNRNGIRAICKVKPANYPAGGMPDANYGTNGLVNIPGINTGENGNINEIKLKSNGGLLAVVQWTSAGNASYGIYFNSISAAGVVDMAFGTNGVKFLQLPGATSIIASRYKWIGQNNDQLMIFGQATVNSATQGFVCKVDLNGDLDPTFGTNGVIWTTETFLGAIGFDNSGNVLAINSYGFFKGTALAKVNIPADVYNRIKPGSWTGTIDSDWFKPGNWAEGVVPDAYTEVMITNGTSVIGANLHAFAYSVRVLGGANLSMGANSTLEITKNNP